jgi:two-component system, response regulator PdtaR
VVQLKLKQFRSSIRVLIVDDSRVVLATTRKALEILGHQIVGEANSGEGIVSLVKETRPDVVVLDLEMPGVNGIEAARQIREEAPVPVVILTGHTEWSWLSDATDAGVHAYLTKPTTVDALQSALIIATARFAELQRLKNESLEDLEAYRALIKSERMAAIGQITTTIRHEINNPLTVVLGNAQLLLGHEQIYPESLKKALEAIADGADRIRRVVKALDGVTDEVTTYLGDTEMIDLFAHFADAEIGPRRQ